MKLKMTIDEALEFADEWSRGLTLHEGSQGWRVVCMLLAEEVRRLRQVAGLWAVHVQGPDDLFAAPTEADAMAVAVHINNALADHDVKPCAVVVPWPLDSEAHSENLRRHWADLVTPNAVAQPTGKAQL